MISVGLGIRAYAAEDIRRSYEALILRRLVPTINPRLRFLGGGFSPLTLRRSRLFAAFDSTKGMKLISGDWPDFELDLAEVRTFKTRYREVADTQVSSDVLSWQVYSREFACANRRPACCSSFPPARLESYATRLAAWPGA